MGKLFENLLNEENPRKVFRDGVSNNALTPDVSREDVVKALSKMKNGKTTWPDNIPAEMWKYLRENGIGMLTDLMSKISMEEKMPDT